MPDPSNSVAYAEVPAAEGGAHEAPSVTSISGPLMLLTWIAFLVVIWVLARIAWKPILRALDQREDSIRRAVEGAEKARKEMAELEARGREAASEAERQSREILESARAAAAATMAEARQQADSESSALIAAARKEIQAATEQARAALRRDSAELAVELAGRLVAENLDSGKNRILVERLLKEL